jgi:hypothetical protein
MILAAFYPRRVTMSPDWTNSNEDRVHVPCDFQEYIYVVDAVLDVNRRSIQVYSKSPYYEPIYCATSSFKAEESLTQLKFKVRLARFAGPDIP